MTGGLVSSPPFSGEGVGCSYDEWRCGEPAVTVAVYDDGVNAPLCAAHGAREQESAEDVGLLRLIAPARTLTEEDR